MKDPVAAFETRAPWWYLACRKRMNFVGGIRGHAEMEKRVDSRETAAAFAIQPTRLGNQMSVAHA